MLPDFERLELIADIASGDEMCEDGKVDHYMAVCRSALNSIARTLLAAGNPPVRRILDLPCGHGRVLRGLHAWFPRAELSACDLLKDGVDFCAETFGATPIYSHPDPERIPLKGTYDVIWVGSLFTHLAEERWRPFFTVLKRHLSVGGVLVFTAHGRSVARHITRDDKQYGLRPSQLSKLLNGFQKRGFSYQSYPGQTEYGVSISAPHWVFAFLESFPAYRIVHFSEVSWDNHHDVYGVTHTADPFDFRDVRPKIARKIEAHVPEGVLLRAERALKKIQPRKLESIR